MMDESRIQLIGRSRPALRRNLHRLWMFILINSRESVFLCGLGLALHPLTDRCKEIPNLDESRGSGLSTRRQGVSHSAALTVGTEASLFFRPSGGHCWRFSSTLVLSPSDAANTYPPHSLLGKTNRVCGHCQPFSAEQSCPQLRTSSMHSATDNSKHRVIIHAR